MEYLSNLEGVYIFLLDKSYRESSFYFERKSKKHSFLFLKHGFFVTIATISLLQKTKKRFAAIFLQTFSVYNISSIY